MGRDTLERVLYRVDVDSFIVVVHKWAVVDSSPAQPLDATCRLALVLLEGAKIYCHTGPCMLNQTADGLLLLGHLGNLEGRIVVPC